MTLFYHKRRGSSLGKIAQRGKYKYWTLHLYLDFTLIAGDFVFLVLATNTSCVWTCLFTEIQLPLLNTVDFSQETGQLSLVNAWIFLYYYKTRDILGFSPQTNLIFSLGPTLPSLGHLLKIRAIFCYFQRFLAHLERMDNFHLPIYVSFEHLQPGDSDYYLSAKPASCTDAHTIINTKVNTRLALQKFINNPDLLLEIESWVHGGLFCNKVSTHNFASKPLHKHQIARFLANFESPIVTIKVAGKTALSCCDSGCSGVLMSFGYFKHLFPGASLNEYCGLPYKQASGDILPLEGQFEAKLSIGPLTAHTTFVVMSGSESYREILLGWKFFKSFQISLCPDGLYLFPSDLLTAHLAEPLYDANTVARNAPDATCGVGSPLGTPSLHPPLTRGGGHSDPPPCRKDPPPCLNISSSSS